MNKTREKISLAALLFVYLFCSFRYFPGHPGESWLATLRQLLTIAPFLVGGTLLGRAFFQRLTNEVLSWSRLARIYLTLGVIVEFFLGLNNYLALGRGG